MCLRSQMGDGGWGRVADRDRLRPEETETREKQTNRQILKQFRVFVYQLRVSRFMVVSCRFCVQRTDGVPAGVLAANCARR